jgi:hypothetical protein
MTPSQVFWQRVWLIVIVVLIAAAYCNGFRILDAISSPSSSLAIILMFASAFCVAMGIRKIAGDFFNIEDYWHASLSGFLFVGFILVLFASIIRALAKVLFDPSIRRALCPEQAQFLIPAFTILWLISMSRPSNAFSSSYRDESNRPPIRVPGWRRNTYGPQRNKRVKDNIEKTSKSRNRISRKNGLLRRK